MFTSHIETIWAAKVAKPYRSNKTIAYHRERWITPDHDFIDVDFILVSNETNSKSAIWVLFHGLEGSSQSHYAKAFASFALENGHSYCVPHFRGCSGEINLAPRAYHSGDFQEIDWILKRIKAQHQGSVYAVGISLGGNALMRWAGEYSNEAHQTVNGVASVCSPLDMVASGHHLAQGMNRYLYTPMFLKSMKKNALLKLAQYPGLFDKEAMLSSKTLHDFDEVFTAPLHGFRNADDYWVRASAKPYLADVKVPALVIHALNDPFIPQGALPTQHSVSQAVRLWQPKRGGHVGFVDNVWSGFPGHLEKLPALIVNYLQRGLLPTR